MLQRVSVSQTRKDMLDAPPSPDVMDNYAQHLRESLRVLKRRRWTIAATAAAFIAAALLFLIIVSPRYTATATVLIDPRRSNVVDSDNGQQKVSSPTSDDATVNSQAVLLQSDAVLRRVVDQLKLGDDPEFGGHSSILGSILGPVIGLFTPKRDTPSGQSPEDIAKAKAIDYLGTKRLKVARDGTTFVVDVSATSESPEKAAKITNAVVDSYFAEQVQGKFDTRKIAAGWFDQQLQALKTKVQASDRAVEEFRAKNNLTITQGVTWRTASSTAS